MLKRIMKKIALLFPSVKNHYRNIENLHCQNEALHNQIVDLRSQNEDLCNQNESLKSNYEQQLGNLRSHFEWQHGADSYRLQQLDNMFEDNVKYSWAEDSERKKWGCSQPFTRIEINMGGFVSTCCPNYLKYDYFIGNAYTDTFDKIWNSDIAKRLRYSVSCGNFEYCNEAYCNALQKPSKYPKIMLPRTGGGG
jgi:FtsZ-binding cell division protein ZapB